MRKSRGKNSSLPSCCLPQTGHTFTQVSLLPSLPGRTTVDHQRQRETLNSLEIAPENLHTNFTNQPCLLLVSPLFTFPRFVTLSDSRPFPLSPHFSKNVLFLLTMLTRPLSYSPLVLPSEAGTMHTSVNIRLLFFCQSAFGQSHLQGPAGEPEP